MSSKFLVLVLLVIVLVLLVIVIVLLLLHWRIRNFFLHALLQNVAHVAQISQPLLQDLQRWSTCMHAETDGRAHTRKRGAITRQDNNQATPGKMEENRTLRKGKETNTPTHLEMGVYVYALNCLQRGRFNSYGSPPKCGGGFIYCRKQIRILCAAAAVKSRVCVM